jgi:hypothetical protein
MSNIKNKILPFVGKDNFLEEFYSLYCHLDNKAPFIQEIISLHNDNLLNIVSEYNKLNNNSNTSKVDFFVCRYIFRDILPFIKADIKEVLSCVKQLTLEAGNDLTASDLITPLGQFCKTNNSCEELLDIGLNNIDESFDCITLAIIAGSELQLEIYTEKAIALCNYKNNIVQKRAIFSLSRINYQSNNILIDKVFTIIKTKVINCSKDFYLNILRLIISLYKQKNDLEEQIIELCSIILKNEDDQLIHVVSEILFQDSKLLPRNIYNVLLKTLTKVNPNNIGTLDYIDYILCDLLKNDIKEDLYVFLEELLIKNNKLSINIFNSFIHELVNNKKDILNILVTRWFLSRRIVLGRAVSEILKNSVDKNVYLAIDKTQLKNLPEGICLFLSRKACGWLFIEFISAVAYIVSLIDISTDKELEGISFLLFNRLLISYPHNIREFFEELLQKEISEKTAKVINNLLAQQELFFRNLNDYESISELKPSLFQRAQYNQYHSKLIDNAYKEANKKSIISQLVTRKTILYGNCSIFYRYNNPEGTNKTREIMPFHHYSHSIAYPSLALLDPHNLDFDLRTFKVEGCYETNN